MQHTFSACVGSGYVQPSTFVQLMSVTADTTDAIAGYTVQQAVVSGIPWGISQMGTRLAPDNENIGNAYAGASAALSVSGADDPIQIYGPGSQGVYLSIATTVKPGDILSPNASGQGIEHVAGSSTWFGALAEEGGTSGDLIRVTVIQGIN